MVGKIVWILCACVFAFLALVIWKAIKQLRKQYKDDVSIEVMTLIAVSSAAGYLLTMTWPFGD